MISPMEIWKNIPGLDDYDASNFGRIRSRKRGRERILRLCLFSKNYAYLQFGPYQAGEQDAMFVHRAVWSAFNGAIPGGMHINHLDSDPSNNHISNLELVTPRENAIHGSVFGRMRRATAHLSDVDITIIRASQRSGAMLAKLFKISRMAAYAIRNGETHVHFKNVSLGASHDR